MKWRLFLRIIVSDVKDWYKYVLELEIHEWPVIVADILEARF